MSLLALIVLCSTPVSTQVASATLAAERPSQQLRHATEKAAEATARATDATVDAAASGWQGPRGQKRIIGLSLTSAGGLLSIVGIALIANFAALSTAYGVSGTRYDYAYPYGYGSGYGYSAYASPVPWLVGGLLALGGAACGLAFGVPMLVRSFQPAET